MLGGLKDFGQMIYQDVKQKLRWKPSSPDSPQGFWPTRPTMGETFPKSADGLSRADVFQAVVDSTRHDQARIREFVAATDKNATVGLLGALGSHGLQIAGMVAGSLACPLASTVLLTVGTGMAVASYADVLTNCWRRDDAQVQLGLMTSLDDVYEEAAEQRKQDPPAAATPADFALAKEWATRP